VKLIDVMRGAVAEVEDYARVTAATQSRAALAGSAVTDVIHLLAELIENATTLSPPFTQVRVSGETVANGFAVEIEDRGLGMTPQRLYELNERLANPPDINPANTEQLGLFVVGQLARRHGIRVVLRPSPYGGTTAVALIPTVLIVEDGPAAITSGQRVPEAAGANGAYAGNGAHNGNGAFSANGSSFGTGGYVNGVASPVTGGARGPVGGGGMPSRPAAATYNGGRPSRTGGFPAAGGPDPRDLAADARNYGAAPQEPGQSTIRIPGGLRHPESTGGPAAPGGFGTGTGPSPRIGAAPGADSGPRRGRHGTDDVPVVTGIPVGRPPQATPPEFDVFTPIRRVEPDAPVTADLTLPHTPYPDFGGPDLGSGASAFGNAPGAGPAQENSEVSPAYGDAGTNGNEAASGNNGNGDKSNDNGEPADDGAGDFKGLPRRVRQASLAPQLRASGAAASQPQPGVPRATAASLTDMRNTLSAMQRGWQQGRSQTTQPDAED
jgi:hypothetical protein